MQGTLPESIGAWEDLVSFRVQGNQFQGTIPAAVSSWRKLTTFNVAGNFFVGDFPVLPFENMPGDPGPGCYPYGVENHTNSFSCPWPAGATEHCEKYNGSTWVLITDFDCDPPSAPQVPAPASLVAPITTRLLSLSWVLLLSLSWAQQCSGSCVHTVIDNSCHRNLTTVRFSSHCCQGQRRCRCSQKRHCLIPHLANQLTKTRGSSACCSGKLALLMLCASFRTKQLRKPRKASHWVTD